MARQFLLIGLFCFFQQAGFAQRNSLPRVTLSLQDASIQTLVTDLEKQTKLFFYYDKVQFDSVRMNFSVKDVPLDLALDQAFVNTEFRYTILQNEGYILLTKGVRISGELPGDFFSRDSKDTSRLSLPEYGDRKDVKIDASIENKIFEIGIKTNSGAAGK
ncbi:MAG TPA: hypothetical protein VK625_18020, partial [Flavitalea sp.]|nr:hypothetical protein [Flavitalea sp.]